MVAEGLGCISVLEHSPGKFEVLSSIPSTKRRGRGEENNGRKVCWTGVKKRLSLSHWVLVAYGYL
jgi:hypothetical protein